MPREMTLTEAVAIAVKMAEGRSPDSEEGEALRMVLREYKTRGFDIKLLTESFIKMGEKLREAMCSTSA